MGGPFGFYLFSMVAMVITMGIAKEPELLTTTAKLQRKDLAGKL